MNPIVVIVSTTGLEATRSLRDELRARSVRCAVLAEPDPCDTQTLASACAALAGDGISAIVATGRTHQARLLADLERCPARVLATQSPAESIVSELEARGWIPASDEVYTDDELRAVTARLRDLGYA
jgi:hypothetical protein